jgi:hypothetical protein
MPAVVEPRCKVCQSEYREAVDKLKAWGRSGSEITMWLQDVGFSVDKRSVNRHLKNHVSFEAEALAHILRQKIARRQDRVEEDARLLVTRDALAQGLIEGGWKRLVELDGKVPFEQALKAAELQQQWEEKEETVKVEELSRQLDCIVQAIKDVLPAEEWDAVAKRARQIYEGSVLALVEAELSPPGKGSSGPPALAAE